MPATESTMLPLGTAAPNFSLPEVTDGNAISLETFAGSRALLVIFLSARCPFVVHVAAELARLGNEYLPQGVGIVAISATDTAAHPEDAPEHLAEFARISGFPFPVVFDESQATAKAYKAACTPDFFLFDSRLKLAYRGQLDDSRPRNDKPVTGADLRLALDALLSGQPVPGNQRPSIGCNIKWKPNSEPSYFHVPA